MLGRWGAGVGRRPGLLPCSLWFFRGFEPVNLIFRFGDI